MFVAVAALLVCRADERSRSGFAFVMFGTGAMLAIGIALQIKYSPVSEGIFFGLALLWIGIRAGRRWSLVAMATCWVVAALLPTILAAASYWAIGHFGEYWFSNFVSIFQRHDLDKNDAWRNAASLSLYLAPLLVLSLHGAKLRHRQGAGDAARFVTLWLIVAIASVAFFGYYFDHYGLPIVLPAAIGTATVLDRRPARTWPILILLGALIGCLVLPTVNQHRRGTPKQFWQVAKTVAPYVPQGMLVWDNLPVLYYVLDAALPTRYPFPTHLRDRNEIGAIGIDQPQELMRILDGHPAIVIVERGKPRAMVRQTTVMLLQRMARDYHEIAAIKVGRRDQLIFLWNATWAGAGDRLDVRLEMAPGVAHVLAARGHRPVEQVPQRTPHRRIGALAQLAVGNRVPPHEGPGRRARRQRSQPRHVAAGAPQRPDLRHVEGDRASSGEAA